MKAAVRKNYGPPSILEVKEVPKPIPQAHEILVKVKVTTVNRTDCAVLIGKPFIMRFFTGLFSPKNASTGTDFAGIVEKVGDEVSSFKSGDRVWGFQDNGFGSHAQYFVLTHNASMRKIPENTSYVDAAASAEAAHYALNFLSKVHIKPEHTVLINGATGAIGSAMVQFVRNIGARIVATANTRNIEAIKGLGADRVIDFTTTDFTQDTEKFDFVLDTVGKSTFSRCKPLLKKEAVYISSELGPYFQNPILALLTKKQPQKVIFPVPVDIPQSLETMGNLLIQEKFNPLIDREYPLEAISEAFTYVASGQKTGNVILRIH